MDNGLLGLKLIILLSLVPVVIAFVTIMTKGRQLAMNVGNRDYLLEDKRDAWWALAWWLAGTVALILMLVGASAVPLTHTWLFRYVHRPAALGFVGIMIFLRWYTGVRGPRFHYLVGYAALIALVVAIGSGALLLSRA